MSVEQISERYHLDTELGRGGIGINLLETLIRRWKSSAKLAPAGTRKKRGDQVNFLAL
ncbi:MAG TPA: hypothetical protein VIK64_04045 [Anaerolineales bacterium]